MVFIVLIVLGVEQKHTPLSKNTPGTGKYQKEHSNNFLKVSFENKPVKNVECMLSMWSSTQSNEQHYSFRVNFQ